MNGSKSTENDVNGSDDIEMGEDTAGAPTSSLNTSKGRNGDEKMTVVVPLTKGSKLTGKGDQEKEEDATMEDVEYGDAEKNQPEIDPTAKAIQGWLSCPPVANNRALFANKNPLFCRNNRH